MLHPRLLGFNPQPPEAKLGGHRHLLPGRTDLQLAIDRRDPDLERDGAAHQLLEVLLGEGYRVASGHDRRRVLAENGLAVCFKQSRNE